MYNGGALTQTLSQEHVTPGSDLPPQSDRSSRGPASTKAGDVLYHRLAAGPPEMGADGAVSSSLPAAELGCIRPVDAGESHA